MNLGNMVSTTLMEHNSYLFNRTRKSEGNEVENGTSRVLDVVGSAEDGPQ